MVTVGALWANLAQAAGSSLCVVAVPFADPANSDGRRLIPYSRNFAGSPWPIFYEAFGGRAWIFDEHGALTRPNEFPNSDMWEKFATEPTGRVIGTKPFGRQVYVQDPGNGQFVGLNGTEKEAIGVVSMPAWITGRSAMLVATSKGLFALTNDTPIPTLKRMDLAEPVGPLAYIFDLPKNRAAALVTADGRLVILDDMNHLRDVPGIQIKKGHWLLSVSELKNSDKLLVEGSHQTWTVPMRKQGDTVAPDRATEITTLKHDGSGGLRYFSAVGQYLVYGTPDRWFGLGGPAMLKLDDDLVAVEGSRGLADYPYIKNVPSLGFVVVQTFSRLYRYDGGGSLEPIPGSLEAEIGKFPHVHDLASQAKVIVSTAKGLYELTKDGKLVRMPLPPELEGAKIYQLAEMPASQLAVVFTDRGIFEIDQAGTFARVVGDEHIEFGGIGPALLTHIPVRETLFFSTYAHKGQFMIVDKRRDAQGACGNIQ